MNGNQMKIKSSNGDLFGGEQFTSPCHHRVLKPPGGAASDIFGAEPEKLAAVPRKLSSQSSINLADEVNGTSVGNGSETGSVKQGSCNERLFGPPLDEQLAKMNGNAANGKEESVADGPAQMNGNGIDKVNGGGAQTNAGAYVGRKRVPPGGYSSGLW